MMRSLLLLLFLTGCAGSGSGIALLDNGSMELYKPHIPRCGQVTLSLARGPNRAAECAF